MYELPTVNNNLLFGGMSGGTGLAGNHTWGKPNSNWLQNMWGGISGAFEAGWDKTKDLLQNTNWNNVASGVASSAAGLMGLANSYQQATHIDEDTNFQQQMANYESIANLNPHSLDQATNIRNQAYNLPRVDEDLNKMTGLEKTSNILSSGLQGMQAGMALGPWGALAGAGVGALVGFLGNKDHETNANIQKNWNLFQRRQAQDRLLINNDADINHIQGSDNAYKTVRAVANGGKIERKQLGIKEYADKVLGTKTSQRIVRQKCNGGVMIRIKG